MSRPSCPRRVSNGFTLIEMIISLTVVAFFTLGAITLLTQQQRSFQNTAADRALQETARAALSQMGGNLRRAGYGMEPALAFDFGSLNIQSTVPPIVTQSYRCPTPVTCRDGSGPDGQDEIVFYARDPAFGRALSAPAATGSLQVSGGLQTPIYQGQILQVMCAGAADWAYVTVSATKGANAGPTTDLALTGGDTDTFPTQNQRLTRACFTTNPGNVHVFKIDRFRYHIARFADPDAPNGRPYLMLDQGLTGPSGLIDEPVAPDVEDLQVAYVFPNVTGGPVTVGATLGTPLADAAASIDLSAVPPLFEDAVDAQTRFNQSPANIRAVKLSVVTRTPGEDVNLGDVNVDVNVQSTTDTVSGGNLVPGSGNSGDWAGDSHHHRLRVETSEATRNLDAQVPYCPPYSTNNGADGLNVGGG
jgi:type IV pilus assembly protein PilW